jgi:hypothetical protein
MQQYDESLRVFVQTGFPLDAIERLDAFRLAQRRPKSRASAVRDLVITALAQQAKGGRGKGETIHA